MAKYSPPSRTFSIPISARRKVYVTSPVFELTTFTFLSYSSSTVSSSVRYKLGDNRKYIFHTSTLQKPTQIHQFSMQFCSVQRVDVCMREMKNKSNQFNLQIIRISSTKLLFLILFSTWHLSVLFAFKSPFENASELLFCAHNRCTIVFACNFNEMTFHLFFFVICACFIFFIRVYFKVCRKTHIECDFDCIVQ